MIRSYILAEVIWKHDDLADDLAIAKGGIPYLNVCLGSPWLNGRKQKTPRADLVVCKPSYQRFCLSIYEIKVTRADFLSDIRSGKWRDYLPHCDRFYFAVCKGVLQKSDIPNDAGLVVRGNKGWSTIKSAPVFKNGIPIDTMKSLIFAKQRRSAREKRLDDVQNMKRNYSRRDYLGRLKAARVLGDEFGKLHEAAMRLGGLDKAFVVLNKEHETQLLKRHL
jgi:hypothetical protein